MNVPTSGKSDLYRLLPSLDEVLQEMAEVVRAEGHAAVADAVRSVLARLRTEISSGRLDSKAVEVAVQGIPQAVERELRQSLQPSLRSVINATGVILHTNLGRAPLGGAVLQRIREIAAGYSNLEFDIEHGERGKRDSHIDKLFAKLFAQQLGEAANGLSTVVVNNNAAAVLLALNTLGEGGEAVVSRGELVEIGGSFRIPDIMAKAGAALREVGTTNRTRVSDYERAIGEKTRLLLRVHRSNFAMVGFTEQPALTELVALGRKHKLPVLEDLGSGALFDLRSIGVSGEPGVTDSLRAGVDIVTYSGDKLLGGPQAGILSGKKELIARIRQNPLFRVLRVDKLTYAGLEATLLAYIRNDSSAVPALRMMHLPADALRQRAAEVQKSLASASSLKIEIVVGESVIGGGAAPQATLPTWLLALDSQRLSAEALAGCLRATEPTPIIARVEEGRVLLDLRTVFPEQDSLIVQALSAIDSL
ncbi:MAG TPA: L-seryl-tRNA(Sec) selenium transferase [Terriglobales bacterium]|jgi:L-seryl-tRNA(Ser) seleniumtransferase|nr:L-seryl-tRNA(Sec) selenium transferase [Terriglobales bacterium]